MTNDSTPTSIASEWLESWSPGNAIKTANSPGSRLDDDIPRNRPELCLSAILEILERIPADPADHYFQVLAAGPLEDLLVYQGENVIDQVEVLTRQSLAFRLLLNGVWSPAINKSVLTRLSKYRTNPW